MKFNIEGGDIMTLVGIGVLIVGVAIVLMAIMGSILLMKLSNMIGSLNRSVEALPEQIKDLTVETGNLIQESNKTIYDLNEKIEAINPVVDLVGNVGTASLKPTASLVQASEKLKEKSVKWNESLNPRIKENSYGAIMMGYHLFKKGKEVKRLTEGTESYDRSK